MTPAATLPARLPTTVDEVTAGWLTGALAQRNPEVRVDSVAVAGTSTKVFLTVRYAAAAIDHNTLDALQP